MTNRLEYSPIIILIINTGISEPETPSMVRDRRQQDVHVYPERRSCVTPEAYRRTYNSEAVKRGKFVISVKFWPYFSGH